MTNQLDLVGLDGNRFRELCVALLRSESFTVREIENLSRDVGFDAEVATDGVRAVVEFKHWRHQIAPIGELRRLLVRVEDARKFVGAERGLLMISAELPPDLDRSWIPRAIDVWDASIIRRKIADNQGVLESLRETQAPRSRSRSARRKERAAELEDRLFQLQAGKPFWREYEDLCVEILNFVFIPPLRAPRLQTRSQDGLDRRDALYLIGRGHPIWDQLRIECQTRFMVAEFKNHSEPPGQVEVESLQQYLYPRAMRSFGILCSRQQPSQEAHLARRRAWMESSKLIVMLGDQEMRLILRLRSEGTDPADIIEGQLDDFFAALSP